MHYKSKLTQNWKVFEQKHFDPVFFIMIINCLRIFNLALFDLSCVKVPLDCSNNSYLCKKLDGT